MNIKSKGSILLFAIIFLLGCNKGSDSQSDPVNPDAYKVQAVTRIDFMILNSSGNPTRIGFKNRTTALGVYNINSTGEYRFEFHGKNGREMLQGDPRNPNITNVAVWSINPGDTIKAFKNGLLYRDFVTEIEDNINDGIEYDLIQGTPIATVRTNANLFVSTNGAFSSMKFKFGL
ncbi:MAG: hypothetical protein U0U70_08075 [Chitinophagaceae bacterium]